MEQKLFTTKAFCFISLLALIINSCANTKDDILDNSEQDTTISTAVKSDAKENIGDDEFGVTQRMAELYVAANKDNPKIVDIEPYIIDGTTCFYIINFEKGYKIISADMRTQPILAESNSDNLYFERLESVGVKTWLEDTADRIMILKKLNPKTQEDNSVLWKGFIPEKTSGISTRSLDPNQDSVWIKTLDLSSSRYSNNILVDHLTETFWGQGEPWYTSMPTVSTTHCLAGCVAVAIGQLLYYFNSYTGTPSDLWHNISIANFNVTGDRTVNLTKSNYVSNSNRWYMMPVSNLAGTNVSYVSDLLLDIGARLSMHYGITKSYVTFNANFSIPNLLQCGISSYFGSYNYSFVSSNINSSKPVIASATTGSNGTGDGHTWLIDGCEDYVLSNVETITYYYVPVEDILNYDNWIATYSNEDMLTLIPGIYNGMQTTNTYYTNIRLLKMNWGENGYGHDSSYGILDSSDWNVNNNNYLYTKVIHYNITTCQLN